MEYKFDKVNDYKEVPKLSGSLLTYKDQFITYSQGENYIYIIPQNETFHFFRVHAMMSSYLITGLCQYQENNNFSRPDDCLYCKMEQKLKGEAAKKRSSGKEVESKSIWDKSKGMRAQVNYCVYAVKGKAIEIMKEVIDKETKQKKQARRKEILWEESFSKEGEDEKFEKSKVKILKLSPAQWDNVRSLVDNERVNISDKITKDCSFIESSKDLKKYPLVFYKPPVGKDNSIKIYPLEVNITEKFELPEDLKIEDIFKQESEAKIRENIEIYLGENIESSKDKYEKEDNIEDTSNEENMPWE